MKMVQVQFERKTTRGIRHTTAWVDVVWKLKVGQLVKFDHEQDKEWWWKVASVGTQIQEYAGINRLWRVGGLA